MQAQTSLVDIAQQVRLSNYCVILGTSILCYEYLMTLDDEVEFFWKPVFGIVNSFGTLSPNNCSMLDIFNQIRIVTVQISVCVIMAIRVYALYGRNRRIFIFLVTFIICTFAVASWSITGRSTSKFIRSIPGCYIALEKEEGIRLSSAWGTLLVYDAVLFLMTLWKAVDIWKTGQSRLLRVLVRDGFIYFFVVVMVNLPNILILLLAPPIMKDDCSSLTSVLSVIMVSRLMVNIKDPKTANTLISGEGQSTSMVFNTFRILPTSLETNSGGLPSMPDFGPRVDRSRSLTWTDATWRVENITGEDTGNDPREN